MTCRVRVVLVLMSLALAVSSEMTHSPDLFIMDQTQTTVPPGGPIPPGNLSERMQVVLASLTDPLFMAGVNITIYCTPILIILGVVGNTMALLVVLKKKNRKISCCTYMAALAVTDSGSLITFGYLWLTIINQTLWTVPACKGWVYVVFLNTAGSGFLLVGVTFDRFMAICFPLKSRVWCTPKRARIMVTCIMAFVAIFYIPMTLMSNVVDGNVCLAFGYESTLNMVLANFNLVLLPVLPFFVLLVMNIMIIRSVKKSGDFKGRHAERKTPGQRREVGEHGDNKGHKDQQSSRDRQLTIMLLTVSCVYVAIILPVSVRALFYSFYDQYVTPHRYAVFVFLYAVINQILFLNNTINFYLYFLTGSKFRKDLKGLIFQVVGLCWKPKKAEDLQLTSSSSNSAQFYRATPTECTTASPQPESQQLIDKH